MIAENRVGKRFSVLHVDSQLLSEGAQRHYCEPVLSLTPPPPSEYPGSTSDYSSPASLEAKVQSIDPVHGQVHTRLSNK